MEILLELDRELFLFLNSFHSITWDVFMYWVTNRYTWIPFYIAFGIYLIKVYRMKSTILLMGAALLILIVDQSVFHLIKPLFSRLRPCHEANILHEVHLVTGCGGLYSFISGHAANTFAISTFLYFWFSSKPVLLLFAWAALVSYSRIYVGVHYPLDILCGALYGAGLGFLFYQLSRHTSQRIFKLL